MEEARARRLVELYADMILRISVHYMKNRDDAEDICQTVFLKYLSQDREWTDDRHEKAWVIRTTINACKDELRSAFFKRRVPLVEAEEEADPGRQPEELSEVTEVLLELPEKYRVSLYLYYYEGYSAREIGEIMGKREETVDAWLSRGRRKLRARLLESGYAREGVAV